MNPSDELEELPDLSDMTFFEQLQQTQEEEYRKKIDSAISLKKMQNQLLIDLDMLIKKISKFFDDKIEVKYSSLLYDELVYAENTSYNFLLTLKIDYPSGHEGSETYNYKMFGDLKDNSIGFEERNYSRCDTYVFNETGIEELSEDLFGAILTSMSYIIKVTV